MNDQYIKHVGYQNTNDCISSYFSQNTITYIAQTVNKLLKKDLCLNIIVPCHIITNVMNDIYESYRPPTGDIFTRYIIPNNETSSYSYVKSLIDQVIEVIYSSIKDNIQTDQRNSKLSIWSSLYGTFNKHGLRQHAPIKIREKRPQPFLFNMNY